MQSQGVAGIHDNIAEGVQDLIHPQESHPHPSASESSATIPILKRIQNIPKQPIQEWTGNENRKGYETYIAAKRPATSAKAHHLRVESKHVLTRRNCSHLSEWLHSNVEVTAGLFLSSLCSDNATRVQQTSLEPPLILWLLQPGCLVQTSGWVIQCDIIASAGLSKQLQYFMIF